MGKEDINHHPHNVSVLARLVKLIESSTDTQEARGIGAQLGTIDYDHVQLGEEHADMVHGLAQERTLVGRIKTALSDAQVLPPIAVPLEITNPLMTDNYTFVPRHGTTCALDPHGNTVAEFDGLLLTTDVEGAQQIINIQAHAAPPESSTGKKRTMASSFSPKRATSQHKILQELATAVGAEGNVETLLALTPSWTDNLESDRTVGFMGELGVTPCLPFSDEGEYQKLVQQVTEETTHTNHILHFGIIMVLSP
jgi:hypothetical protein